MSSSYCKCPLSSLFFCGKKPGKTNLFWQLPGPGLIPKNPKQPTNTLDAAHPGSSLTSKKAISFESPEGDRNELGRD